MHDDRLTAVVRVGIGGICLLSLVIYFLSGLVCVSLETTNRSMISSPSTWHTSTHIQYRTKKKNKKRGSRSSLSSVVPGTVRGTYSLSLSDSFFAYQGTVRRGTVFIKRVEEEEKKRRKPSCFLKTSYCWSRSSGRCESSYVVDYRTEVRGWDKFYVPNELSIYHLYPIFLPFLLLFDDNTVVYPVLTGIPISIHIIFHTTSLPVQ